MRALQGLAPDSPVASLMLLPYAYEQDHPPGWTPSPVSLQPIDDIRQAGVLSLLIESEASLHGGFVTRTGAHFAGKRYRRAAGMAAVDGAASRRT
jgi:hypothetical protein